MENVKFDTIENMYNELRATWMTTHDSDAGFQEAFESIIVSDEYLAYQEQQETQA